MFGFVTAAAKGTRTCLWPKKVRLENTGNYEIYNPQALSSALAVAPAQILHRQDFAWAPQPGSLGYKFHRSLCFEV